MNNKIKIICKTAYNGYKPGDIVKTLVYSRWGCQDALRFCAKHGNNYSAILPEEQ